jgi:chromosomal replication initiation ATPase DnaA
MTRDVARTRILNELNNDAWSDITIMEILFKVNVNNPLDIETLISASAVANGITEDEVKSGKRKRPYVLARSFCYKMLREEGHSLHHIGRTFGKGHATVLNGLRRLQYDFDSNYKPTIIVFDHFKRLLTD